MPLADLLARNRTRALAAACVAAASALAAMPALAQKPMVVLEEVLETTTDLVALPGSPGGSITARECRECPSHRVQFGEGTRYFVNDQAVSYTRFRQTAAQASARLYVYFAPQTGVLTRLRLNAAQTAE